MRRAIRVSVVMVAIASLALLASPVAAPAQKVNTTARATLRVGFWTLWRDRQIQVTSAGIASYRTCDHCVIRQLPGAAIVRTDQNGGLTLTIGSTTIHTEYLQLSGSVKVAGHGELETLRYPVDITARNGILQIAVVLPVESYVEQVVASESGPADNLESLEALAIVVRSYALHERHGHPDYDLCDSTHCQLLLWHAALQRRSAAHIATLQTAGETLWFHGRRALAYFNKDCGGQSAAMNEVWPKSVRVPYLASGPDRYCVRTSPRQWATQLSHTELESALAVHGIAGTGWRNLSVGRRAESGRAVTVRLDQIEVSAEEFRIAVGESLGWNHIPSTWFEVSQSGDLFFFHGRGLGHGVGLCQKGAAMMGAQGRSAGDILAQYFPGTEPVDEFTGKPWITFAGSGFGLETLDAEDADLLPVLSQARVEAAQRSGLNSDASFTVRAFVSTPAFRDLTQAPGWISAFTEEDWIATQPLHTLAARHLLEEVMLHEFLHALVEREAGPGVPLWLREGLVEVWSRNGVSGSEVESRAPAIRLDAADAALAHSESEAQSEAAHRAAGFYVQRMLDRYGRARVLAWLRSGVPPEVLLRAG